MTKPKDSKIAVIFRNGAMISNPARNGAPKRFRKVEPAHGMKRQTSGALHPYLHGHAVDDETCAKPHLQGETVPVAHGMHSRSNGSIDAGPDGGSKILRSAAILDWEHKHGDIAPAQLPPKNRGR